MPETNPTIGSIIPGPRIRLARELGVPRRVLYQWRDRMEQTDSSPGRSCEVILRKQILKLKRLLANKTLEKLKQSEMVGILGLQRAHQNFECRKLAYILEARVLQKKRPARKSAVDTSLQPLQCGFTPS